MDFVMNFHKTTDECDSIWVIVDRMTKLGHFILFRIIYPLWKLAKLSIEKNISLHGILSSIVSNRDPKFTSRFWGSLKEDLGTKMRLNFAHHPQADGQTERTIQSLEDFLRDCVLEKRGAWDNYLSLIDFTYNNSFHPSIRMSLFEVLYGRRHRTLSCMVGDVQHTSEKMKVIQKKMKASQSRPSIYHDKRRKSLEFQEGDHVFLRVTRITGVGRALKSRKLTSHFIGMYQIL